VHLFLLLVAVMRSRIRGGGSVTPAAGFFFFVVVRLRALDVTIVFFFSNAFLDLSPAFIEAERTARTLWSFSMY
jgi:hypothetical protein